MEMDETAVLMMRSVHQVATGVDKEEEEEHHLKMILENAPTTASTDMNIYIPIPHTQQVSNVDNYEALYDRVFQLPNEYCRAPLPPKPFLFSGSTAGNNDKVKGGTCGAVISLNHMVGFAFGAKCPLSVNVPTPPRQVFQARVSGRKSPSPLTYVSSAEHRITPITYNMTREDAAWLAKMNAELTNKAACSISDDVFEKGIWILECVANLIGWEKIPPQFISFSESNRFIDIYLNEQEYKALAAVQEPLFNYWKSKRIRGNCLPLVATVKLEDSLKNPSLSANSFDPYVCFRRRELRTLRKTRRADVQSLEKLRQLKGQFMEVLAMLETVLERDLLKKQAFLLEAENFAHTIQLEEWISNFPGIVSIRKNLIPSTASTVENKAYYFMSNKRFKTVLADSMKDEDMEGRRITLSRNLGFGSGFLGPAGSAIQAKLFCSTKTYRDLRRIYSRSSQDSQPIRLTNVASSLAVPSPSQTLLSPMTTTVVHTPSFSSTAPWATFFHPIDVARSIERDLERAVDDAIPNTIYNYASLCATEWELPNIYGKSLEARFWNEHQERPGLKCRYRYGRGGRLLMDRSRGPTNGGAAEGSFPFVEAKFPLAKPSSFVPSSSEDIFTHHPPAMRTLISKKRNVSCAEELLGHPQLINKYFPNACQPSSASMQPQSALQYQHHISGSYQHHGALSGELHSPGDAGSSVTSSVVPKKRKPPSLVGDTPLKKSKKKAEPLTPNVSGITNVTSLFDSGVSLLTANGTNVGMKKSPQIQFTVLASSGSNPSSDTTTSTPVPN